MALLSHGGGAGSYHNWIGFDLRQRRGVVALTTSARFSIEEIGQAALRRLALRDNVLEITSEIVGIGASLKLEPSDHTLRITQIIPNSPAFQAGLPAGLIIQKIDDIFYCNQKSGGMRQSHSRKSRHESAIELVASDGSKTNTMEITRAKFQIAKR
jgi:C-terminal processing protease CtpA/Prc